jgi:predicted permease
MLALGIGATTGMYSIYHTALQKPLPVPAPEQLVNLTSPGPKWGSTSSGMAGRSDSVFSYPMYRDLQQQQDVLAGIAAHRSFDANIAYERATLAGEGMLVSGNYFQVLQLQPALGRLIGPQDEPRVDESPVAVLSYEYWQNNFGGDRNVINRPITVNGQVLTIVGVAPEGFSGTTLLLRPQVFVPLTLRWLMSPTAQKDSDDRRSYWVYLFARLRSDVALSQAAAGLNNLYRGLLAEVEGPLNSDMPANVLAQFLARELVVTPDARGQSNIDINGKEPLTLLLGVTVLVLVVVCVNIASLLLARSEARLGETAVRASVGASRWQLISQLLSESAMLAILGAIASIPVAAATIGAVVAMMPAQQGGSIAFELDAAALVFAAAVSSGALLLFALFPALRASRVQPGALMNAHSRKSTGSRAVLRFRAVLATSQIALSMVLLVLAGLFFQSLNKISQIDLGMEVDSLVSFSVSPRLNGYDNERVTSLFDRLEEELLAQPGVTHVAASMLPLLTGSNMRGSLSFAGREQGAQEQDARFNAVNRSFFSTLSVPLLAGRNFSEADTSGAPRVAIVNQSFLREYGLDQDAIGSRFGMRGPETQDIEIIGISADAKYSEVKDRIPPQFYLPIKQVPWELESLTFYLRSDASADVLMQSTREIVSRVDPNLPVNNLTAVREVVEDNVFLDRMIGMLSTGLAALATVLAAIGLYSVLAYSVSQRTREFGLRQALGATPDRLRAAILKQVGAMALIGGGLGLAVAFAVGRLAESLLFEVSASDPVVLVFSCATIFAVLFLAGSIPARRASRIAPMEALRYE